MKYFQILIADQLVNFLNHLTCPLSLSPLDPIIPNQTQVIVQLRMSRTTPRDDGMPPDIVAVRGSDQMSINGSRLASKSEKDSLTRPRIRNLPGSNSSLNLTLILGGLFSKNPSFWAFSAIFSIENFPVEEIFVERDRERASRVEPEFTFSNIKTKDFATLSVAIFVYDTEAKGKTNLEVSTLSC